MGLIKQMKYIDAPTMPYEPIIVGYDLIIKSVANNFESLSFLKEFFNKQTCSDLNVLQISKTIKKCKTPFTFLKLTTYDYIVINQHNIDYTIEQFNKYGFDIEIKPVKFGIKKE